MQEEKRRLVEITGSTTHLQHAAQDGLLTHKVRLDLRDKGRLEDTRAVAAGRRRVRLRNLEAVALRVVLRVHRD